MTLGFSYTQLMQRVGSHLGYMDVDGDHLTDMDARQRAESHACVNDGYRIFLMPAALPGMPNAYQWSFLRPIRTISVVTDIYEYDLPNEYAGLWGPLTVRTTTGVYPRICVVAESALRQKRSQIGTGHSGHPVMAAIYPKAQNTGFKQGFALTLWPTPDESLTLEVRMLVAPQELSDTNLYPLGGDMHGQTVLEACLAEAERRLGDMDGHHRGAFMERLTASIELDKQQSRGEHLGFNGDPGTPEAAKFRGGGVRPYYWLDSSTTYQGVQY